MSVSRTLFAVFLTLAPLAASASMYPGLFNLRATLNLDARASLEQVKAMYKIHAAELVDRDLKTRGPKGFNSLLELWDLEQTYEDTFKVPAPVPNIKDSRLKKNPGFTIFSEDNPFALRAPDCASNLAQPQPEPPQH